MTISVKYGNKYDLVEIDLGVEHKDEELEIVGDVISVLYLTGDCQVKLDEKDNPAIDLKYVHRIDLRPMKFKKLFITNTAQSGKKCILAIGKEASFSATSTRIAETDEFGNLYAHLKARAPDTNAVVELQTQSEDYKNLRVAIYDSEIRANIRSADVDNITPQRTGLQVISFIHGFDGSNWQRLRCDDVRKTLKTCPDFTSGTVTVTDIDAETLVLEQVIARWRSISLIIKNTGANDLDVKVEVEAYSGGLRHEILSYTTLSPGEQKAISFNDVWHKMFVYAKASVSGNPSDCRVDYIFRT